MVSISDHVVSDDEKERRTSLLVHLLIIANACMPTIQNSITIFAGTPTYAIYYFCFTQQSQHVNGAKHRFEVTVTVITWLLVMLAVAGSIWTLFLFGSTSAVVITLAKFWGVASAITNTVQWIPQINATWTAQHEGILSMWSLVISVLSDILVAMYWAFGPGEPFWVYMSNATDATLQFALIGMISYFRFRRRRNSLRDDHHGLRFASLSTPLLLTSANINKSRNDNENAVVEQVETQL